MAMKTTNVKRKNIAKGKKAIVMPLVQENYMIFGSGIIVLIFGYFSLTIGPWDSFCSRTLATQVLGIGYCGGFFSGLLGIGGGLIFIPSFIFLIKLPIKKAFGTSLAVITAVAIPGSVIHYFLGHIDLTLLLFLIIGVVPGAYLGARFSIWAKEAWLYVLFGLFFGGAGIVFLVKELLALL